MKKGEWSQREIARRFSASLSFVVRLLQHQRRTGGLAPKPHGGGAGFKLSVDDRSRLFDLVGKHPDATLKELRPTSRMHWPLHLHSGDVVVMDNLRVHDSQAARAAIERVGAKVISLPPYSPDDNPIEEMWSKVKALVRRPAATTTPDLYQAIAEALEQVTLPDIAGWFRHSGLYATPG